MAMLSLTSRAAMSAMSALSRVPASRVAPRHFAPAMTRSFAASYPSDRKYKPSHEWVKMDGDIATIGITEHAQKALGEIVFADLPDGGTEFDAGDSAAAVESVKAAGEIYAPLAGEVTETNAKLEDEPALINESPHDDGWMFQMKVSDVAAVDELLDADAYAATLEE